MDLALLSSLPLQSRVTALRSAGRADDWGGDQRFMYPLLLSNYIVQAMAWLTLFWLQLFPSFAAEGR